MDIKKSRRRMTMESYYNLSRDQMWEKNVELNAEIECLKHENEQLKARIKERADLTHKYYLEQIEELRTAIKNAREAIDHCLEWFSIYPDVPQNSANELFYFLENRKQEINFLLNESEVENE